MKNEVVFNKPFFFFKYFDYWHFISISRYTGLKLIFYVIVFEKFKIICSKHLLSNKDFTVTEEDL